MKTKQIIHIGFFFLIFEGCSSSFHISGRYAHVFSEIAGEEFTFMNNPNKFNYSDRTEGTIKAFSTGGWSQDKNKIILNGFNEKNLKLLPVIINVKDCPGCINDKIVVQYKNDALDEFTKIAIIINGNMIIAIQNDTTFFSNIPLRSIQVKSYLIHEGLLLGAPPKIDTLFSNKIEINDNNKHIVTLRDFNISFHDFYRIKLTDTLLIKNDKTLLWSDKKLKKNNKVLLFSLSRVSR